MLCALCTSRSMYAVIMLTFVSLHSALLLSFSRCVRVSQSLGGAT